MKTEMVKKYDTFGVVELFPDGYIREKTIWTWFFKRKKVKQIASIEFSCSLDGVCYYNDWKTIK